MRDRGVGMLANGGEREKWGVDCVNVGGRLRFDLVRVAGAVVASHVDLQTG